MRQVGKYIGVLAVLVILAGVGLLVLDSAPSGDKAAEIPAAEIEGAAVAVDVGVAEDGSDESATNEDPAFVEASGELRTAYEERRDALPPEVAEPLARDLNMIESAISEIGAALVNDPENDSLKQMLVATYRNQIKVLKHALKIAGDDPEDYVPE